MITSASAQAATPAIRTIGVIRCLVGLHLVALFILPKTSFGLVSLRPEDFTGVSLIGLALVLGLSGPLALPRGAVWTAGVVYLTYFWVIFLVRDAANGYLQAIVLWAKEASYFVFGYLVWRGYRSDPRRFFRMALLAIAPTVCFGAFQILTTARGIYGVSPLGHEASPASSGMVYLACSILVFLHGLSGRHAVAARIVFIVTLLLVVSTGSKIAVLGAAAFYGSYMLQEAWHRRSVGTFMKLAWYGVMTVGLLITVVTLARLGLAPNALTRYTGFTSPWEVLYNRGIWWKIEWIDGPIDAIFGAGYSVSHMSDGSFSYGMAMDNQILYYLVTGGAVGLMMYGLLCLAIVVALPSRSESGMRLRALVVSYVFMGLGGEVLQLSVFGNVFWMVIGVAYTLRAVPVGNERRTGADSPLASLSELSATPG